MNRKFGSEELGFVRKIEEILDRISSLDRSGKTRNIRWKEERKGGGLPVFTFVNSPVGRRCEGSAKTPMKVEPRKFDKRKIGRGFVRKSLEFGDFEGKMLDKKERFKRVLMLTQRMVSNESLRGWSRN